jgi:hypothetical protein
MAYRTERIELERVQESEMIHNAAGQVWFNGQAIGWIGSAAHHYELGPIATAVINRKAVPDGPVRVPTRHDYVNASVQDVVIP